MDDPRVDITVTDSIGWTPLHVAAITSTSTNIRALLEAGTDVNQRDIDGRTPLTHAALSGHADVVAVLLSAPNVGPNVTDRVDYTPLLWAVLWWENAMIVQLLRDERILPYAERQEKDTAFMVAVTEGFSGCMRRILLREDTDVNCDSEWSKFILHKAICKGDLGILRLLIEDERLDLLKMDDRGWTPMFCAVGFGSAKIIELLYKSGRFSIDDRDAYRRNAV